MSAVNNLSMSTQEFHQQLMSVKNQLKAFALSLTNDSTMAEDLMQDTVLRALKNKDKFRLGTNFRSWIMTLMKNLFINQYRKRKRAKVQYMEIDDRVSQQATNNKGLTNLLSEQLNNLVEDLDQEFKIPFMMMYQGFKYQEIADALARQHFPSARPA
ncbi:MAG: RNA polymerase sigma factor, partial [Bacteroidota bacterium]